MSDAATGLTTLELVKQFAGITEGSSDDLIKNLIRQVTDEIEQGIKAKILRDDYVEAIDGSSLGALVLQHSPVIELTDLSLNGTTVDADTYELNEEGAFIQLVSDGVLSSWVDGVANYLAIYTAGYDVIPAGLEGIATDIVARRVAVISAGKIGTVSQVLPSGGATSYESREITEAEWTKLRNWGARG